MSVQASCTLMSTGQVPVGVYVFEVILEDFPTKNVTVTYNNGEKELFSMTSSPLCKVTLQFSVESKSILIPYQCWFMHKVSFGVSGDVRRLEPCMSEV